MSVPVNLNICKLGLEKTNIKFNILGRTLRSLISVPHLLFFSKNFHYYWWLFFYLMVKSSKPFVKIRSHFQIALFFWFFFFVLSKFPPFHPFLTYYDFPPLIWIYIMLQFKNSFFIEHIWQLLLQLKSIEIIDIVTVFLLTLY